MELYLLAVAVLPVFVLAVVVYRQDKYEKEPIRKLIKAFIFGALSIIPAALSEQFMSLFDPEIPIISGIYDGYLVAGSCEEFWKLVMLSWAIWRSREFNEYFDGIVYASFVSLGFACFENMSYIFGEGTFMDALTTGSMRAILSVPGHFLFGVTMGYYFALAKFDRSHRARHFFMAFFVPMLLHGTFDALLMIPESMGADDTIVSGILFVILIWFDIKMWKWGVRRIKRLQELSEQQNFDRSSLFKGFIWKF